MKVGQDLEADDRRAALIREALGDDGRPDDGREPGLGRRRGDRGDARLGALRPWWIEEPTSPDDVLGHARIRREVAPIRVATGEHVQNRVIFKQLLQAEAIDFCQIDACRVGGVNEVLAILLLAAKFGVPRLSARRRRRPVRVRAAPRGLRLPVRQRLARGPRRRVGRPPARALRDPAVVVDGRYRRPQAPGYSIEMLPESLDRVRVSNGTDLERAGALKK